MRTGFERGAELAAHGVVRIGDAQGAGSIGGGQQLRRDQQQQHRLRTEHALDLVAPGRAAAQVVLVEEHLLVAETRAEVARQRGRLVLAVGGAVADEDACRHSVQMILRTTSQPSKRIPRPEASSAVAKPDA